MEIKGKVHYVGVNDRTKALFENLWRKCSVLTTVLRQQ